MNMIAYLGNHNTLPHKEDRLLIIYPNPANDILNVNIEKLIPFQNPFNIQLYDIQGDILSETKSKDRIIRINVSDFPEGIYFLHIYGGISTTPETFKIIVKH